MKNLKQLWKQQTIERTYNNAGYETNKIHYNECTIIITNTDKKQ